MSGRVRNPARVALRRFADDPASVRYATIVLVIGIVVVVLVASLVVWIFDKRDFPDYGVALWFTLQTATTVGYGDVTPTSGVGRAVAGVVLLFSIAFIAVLTALITSVLIDAGHQRRRRAQIEQEEHLAEDLFERFDELGERLARIEARLDRSEGRAAPPGPTPTEE
jgi:voltage-gated potassium channel